MRWGKRRGDQKLRDMSLEELEFRKSILVKEIAELSVGIPENLDELVAKYDEEKKWKYEEFRERRGRLRADPRNQNKKGIFDWGPTTWTAECEQKCRQIDEEETALVKYFYKLDEARRNRKFRDDASVKLSLIQRHIERRKRIAEAEKQKKLKLEALKVRAKRNEDEVRAMATSIKSRLSEKRQDCPYCGGSVGESPHADHIYPVSKGGLSIDVNIVIVCAKCNLRKKDLTLREFIAKFSMNRDEIEKRLEEQGKSF